MTYAAQLKGLELPKPGTNIRIEPYTLYQYDRVKDNQEATINQQPKIGGDQTRAVQSGHQFGPKQKIPALRSADFDAPARVVVCSAQRHSRQRQPPAQQQHGVPAPCAFPLCRSR